MNNTLETLNGPLLNTIKEKVSDFVEKGEKGKLTSPNILVVGDIGLDEYIYGAVDRISPEAPVPVVHVSEKFEKLGLSANVAQNIVSLGGKCELFSLVGEDETALKMERHIKEVGDIKSHFVRLNNRPTTVKTRVLSGQHHLLRMDEENKSFLSEEEETQALKKLEELNFESYNVVILEDYGKGFLTQNILKTVINKSLKAGVKIFVDPSKGRSPLDYKGATVFKPNFKEAMAYETVSQAKTYEDLLSWIKKEGQYQAVVSTLGAQGMSLYSEELKCKVPTFAKKVFDVTGAGDTVIASMSVACAHGLSLVEGIYFSNLAAGHVVEKIGAVTTSFKEISEGLEGE